MLKPSLSTKTIFFFCILNLWEFFRPNIWVVCDAMSTTDGDELIASLQNLDLNTKKITDFLKVYKRERTSEPTKTNIELHPSLWSSEYYQVVNPKTSTQTVTFNQSIVQTQPITDNNENGSSSVEIFSNKNKAYQETFLSKLKTRNRKNVKERRQSSYTIERDENKGVANELIGFGASSRTVIQPVDTITNTSLTTDKSDNALKWIKTSGYN